MISQKNIINQLTPDKKKELIKICLEKYEKKINNDDFNSVPAILPTILIIARTLVAADYNLIKTECDSTSIHKFSTTSILTNKGDIDDLLRISSKFSNQ